MKKKFLSFLSVALVFFITTSCDKESEEDALVNKNEDKELKSYVYSEDGFFINGEIIVKGYFETDSVIEGFTKFVDRTAHYCAVDQEEGDMNFGYGLLVGINEFAKFYSDKIQFNSDSTAFSCKGGFEFLTGQDTKVYDAQITSKINEKGQPCLIICKVNIEEKNLVMQFSI